MSNVLKAGLMLYAAGNLAVTVGTAEPLPLRLAWKQTG
jgi:hypothetical protein